MIRKHVQAWINWLKHVVTEPRHQLNRWQSAVRFSYDLGIHGWKALNRDNAPQMAAALAFRTLFALLPVLVVSTVVVRAVQGTDKFMANMRSIFTALGLYAVELVPDESLGSWLEELIKSATGLNLAALGWVGLVVVAYSAISLLVTIENSFNAIYGAPEGRSWLRRVPTYWLLLTMSPVVIGITLYMDNSFSQAISHLHAWKWLLTVAKLIWGFTVAWLFMFAVYRLVPNTKVGSKPAMIGGFVSAFLLSIGTGSLGAYFNHAVTFESLYGQLGLIPVFMFWVYLMWLVILFGLEVSATIQTLQGRSLEELEPKRPQNGLVDPAAVLSVMEIVTERFAESRPTTQREISDETHIAEGIVCQILDRLVHARLLHRLERDGDTVSLACPPDQISADRLIEIGYNLVDAGGVGHQSPLVHRMREAQKSLAQHATLATLLAANGQHSAEDQVVVS